MTATIRQAPRCSLRTIGGSGRRRRGGSGSVGTRLGQPPYRLGRHERVTRLGEELHDVLGTLWHLADPPHAVGETEHHYPCLTRHDDDREGEPPRMPGPAGKHHDDPQGQGRPRVLQSLGDARADDNPRGACQRHRQPKQGQFQRVGRRAAEHRADQVPEHDEDARAGDTEGE